MWCPTARPTGKIQDLLIVQQEIYRLHSNDRLCYRDFYKELLTEERQLDVVRTVSGECPRIYPAYSIP